MTWRTGFVFCVLAALGCGGCGTSGGVIGGAPLLLDTVSGADAAGQLSDAWQLQPDASPPDDAWTWNADVAQWQKDGVALLDVQAADTLADGVNPQDGVIAQDGALVPDNGAAADTAAADGSKPAPGQPGAKCLANKECASGFCAGAGTADGYCATYGCKTSSDCGFSAEWPVCCVTYAGEGYCLKQFGATTCGAQDKAPGQSCVTGGQSDCTTGSGNWCFQQGNQAQCVQGCTASGDACPAGTACQVFPGGGGCLPFTAGVKDGTPCAGKTIGGCGKGAYCIENAPGDSLAYCATGCKSDAECGTGRACTSFGAAEGACIKYGDRPAGKNCADDRFSCAKGLWCVGGDSADAVCTPQCTVDANCDSFAAAVAEGLAYCAKSAGSAVGVCYPKGITNNGDSCDKDPYDCAAGYYCMGGYDTWDPNAYCQKSCGGGTDGACPTGSKCIVYSADYSGCQVEGFKGQGESCAGNPTSCMAGSFCVGAIGKEVCMLQCKVGGSDCPSGAWCAAYGDGKLGVCMGGGAIAVGQPCGANPWGCMPYSFCEGYGATKDAVCIAACGGSGACPNGTDCKDFGQAGNYCEPAGKKTQGQSCVDDGNSCAPGHVCISKDTPQAMCSKQCKSDAECASGEWCGIGKWGGYCLPDGAIQKNGICYQNPWGCAKGLICLGDASSNPGAFCAAECSGFASLCAADEKCEYLGGGQSWCFKTGKLPHGSICYEDPQGCDPTTLCIKGSPEPTCLQTCGVGKPDCPADSPCTYFVGSALKLCVPKGFTPFGSIRVPF